MQAHRQGVRRGREIVAHLDIGTSKIACLITVPDMRAGEQGDAPGLRVVGLGHQPSKGVKAGVITDLDEAERAVRVAVSQAERMAGVTLDGVVVSISCGRLRSHNFSASTGIESHVVNDRDLARAAAGGRAYAERDGRMLVHMNRGHFRLDGADAGNDPRGMAAKKLSVDLHAVTADEAPVRNLLMVVERCYLNAYGIVAAPFASALAATTEEERRLGVTCIDIGGGTATIAVFADGWFVCADAVPVGGNHITFDIARALQTPLAEAERIKALYGALVSAQSDAHEVISYPLAGEDEGATSQITKAHLAEVIRPRVAGLFGIVKERLDRASANGCLTERVVLTGGSSQLVGIAEFAANALGCPVRVARPKRISGLPQSVASPAFSTVIGLVEAGQFGSESANGIAGSEAQSQSYLGRVGQWLKEGF